MILKTFGLFLFFSSSQSKNNFMPNLPLGEYRLVIDKVYICGSRTNHTIQFNIYSSKKTWNITEMKGNLTFLTPFDDNLTGEYRLVIDKVYPCGSRTNQTVQFNIYSSKKTWNITEIKGNMTYLTPFDDNLTLDVNFSSWGSTGGWIPNYYILTKKKACSTVINLYGNAWISTVKGFNYPTKRCPVPVGTYITSGFDLTKMEDNNFPKVIFYGKYKMVARLKNVENKEVGCVVAETNFMRPWEKPI